VGLKVVEPAGQSAVERLVEDYLASCRARGLSPRTVREGYGYPLRQVLLPFCAADGVSEPAQLDRKLMDRLTSHLLEEGGRRGQLSKFTVASYVRAINAFLSWARREGEVGDVKAQTPKTGRKLVEILSREEIQRLEDAAQTERDRLIVRLLADSGIRVSELTGLRVTDLIDRERRLYVRIHGKGNLERLVPLLPQLGRRLRRFADKGRPEETDSDRIFLGLHRRPGGSYEPLTRTGVVQMLRMLADRAGLHKRVHPHLLRHSFATHSLAHGMNPVQLAQILGHSSLAMIQNVYAHLTPQDSYDALLQALREDG
jgi:integrase